MNKVDTIIVGAGAAGLMCAIEAGKRNREVLLIDHANKPGKKILMSGGGRCNFTNLDIGFNQYFSNNNHFVKSALSRYTQWDFISLVAKHQIPYHEKKHGQLFCDNKSKDIVDMLVKECQEVDVQLKLKTIVQSIEAIYQPGYRFKVCTNTGEYLCQSLVIATGGLSIPTMGATPFGYKVAEQFGIKVWPLRAGLVPFTLHQADKEQFSELSGVSIPCQIATDKITFTEDMLFTHRGLSGPAVLQASSYWTPGQAVNVNLLPSINLMKSLVGSQKQRPKQLLKTVLSEYLPKRLIATLLPETLLEQPLQTLAHKQFEKIAKQLHQWQVKPNGTEGYRTAEVTIGGVDTHALSSKTMEVNQVPGLYFIGEVLDVTGWLGGYNFQWAWSSGWAAGQVV